jgi:protease I
MFGNDSSKQRDIHAVAPIPERLRKSERIAILTGDKVEDVEFFYPYYRLTEEGYQVDVITPEGGTFVGKHGMGLNASKSIREVHPQDYALLYLPGGKAPEILREDGAVIAFVRAFAQSGKPIAAVCHGPQILVTADLVRGRTLAAYWEVAEEIEQAGGTFADEALKIDGQFITARIPGDLHRHLNGVLNVLQGRYASGEAEAPNMARARQSEPA